MEVGLTGHLIILSCHGLVPDAQISTRARVVSRACDHTLFAIDQIGARVIKNGGHNNTGRVFACWVGFPRPPSGAQRVTTARYTPPASNQTNGVVLCGVVSPSGRGRVSTQTSGVALCCAVLWCVVVWCSVWLRPQVVVAKELKLTRAECGRRELRMLWWCLDRDENGFVTVQEFGGFMRRLEKGQVVVQVFNCSGMEWNRMDGI